MVDSAQRSAGGGSGLSYGGEPSLARPVAQRPYVHLLSAMPSLACGNSWSGRDFQVLHGYQSPFFASSRILDSGGSGRGFVTAEGATPTRPSVLPAIDLPRTADARTADAHLPRHPAGFHPDADELEFQDFTAALLTMRRSGARLRAGDFGGDDVQRNLFATPEVAGYRLATLAMTSDASISQYLARLSSVADMTDTLPTKPGAASGDSSLLQLERALLSLASVNGADSGARGGGEGGHYGCHAFSNAFRQSGSIHSGMSGSVEGFLARHETRSGQRALYAALYDGETHGIGAIKQPLQPHALVQVNAAPAVKKGAGTVGGGGAARGCRGLAASSAAVFKKSLKTIRDLAKEHVAMLERPAKCQRAEGSGAHVRARPEMQLKARSGQAHWHDKAKDMREIWNKRRMHFAGYSEFPEQMEMCAKLQIKSQHECLLRELHLSVADGLITPKAFSTSQNDSFLGWTGFQIESTRAREFRQRVEALFPEPPEVNTLHTAFRRTGLVPAKWEPGWLGSEPFDYDSRVRQSYTQYTRAREA